jgi:hypothetical protein
MKKTFNLLQFNHKTFWIKKNVISLLYSIMFLIIAFFIQKFADNYVIKTWGTVVWDIFLNNIPVYDIDKFIVYSTLACTFLTIILLIFKPNHLLFTIKSLALFVIIRSFFISLTHLWIHPHQIIFDSDTIGFWLYNLLYNSNNDFFFSWHTWIPFLIALILQKEKFWRNIYFATSAIFWISVIIWHIHYSIDVFAAPLITYSIYSLAKNYFKKDFELMNK